MVRPNPRFDIVNQQDISNKLDNLSAKVEANQTQYNQDFKGGLNPTTWRELPSWWKIVQHEFGEPYADGYQQQHWTREEALEFSRLVIKINRDKQTLDDYRCSLGEEYYCRSWSTGGFNDFAELLEKEINTNTPPHIVQLRSNPQYYKDIGYLDEQENIITSFPQWQLPEIITQVFAEEDPSINSGLNGNEQETQVINYPQSANVRIVISNISMFSTSIPINDISQLQILSNASNEWRYTLIGTSTNQPLMTLSGLINKINSMIASAVTPQPQPPTQPPIEEEPVTTDHITPPEVEPEVPMVTVTPTEPGQVNWIPEPFFSFINNVFRR